MKASIIGGGLVGSLWSIYLSKIGYNVKVFEKRAEDLNLEELLTIFNEY